MNQQAQDLQRENLRSSQKDPLVGQVAGGRDAYLGVRIWHLSYIFIVLVKRPLLDAALTHTVDSRSRLHNFPGSPARAQNDQLPGGRYEAYSPIHGRPATFPGHWCSRRQGPSGGGGTKPG
jgi:hypothetical protein